MEAVRNGNILLEHYHHFVTQGIFQIEPLEGIKAPKFMLCRSCLGCSRTEYKFIWFSETGEPTSKNEKWSAIDGLEGDNIAYEEVNPNEEKGVIPSLFPDFDGVYKGEKPPVTILREQAGMLGRKTKNIITAKVDADRGFHEEKINSFAYYLHIDCDPIRKSLNVLRISYDENLYPVNLEWKEGKEEKKAIAETREKFEALLREIFHSKWARTVLNAMVVHALAEE